LGGAGGDSAASSEQEAATELLLFQVALEARAEGGKEVALAAESLQLSPAPLPPMLWKRPGLLALSASTAERRGKPLRRMATGMRGREVLAP
jgi:hypothetical protein